MQRCCSTSRLSLSLLFLLSLILLGCSNGRPIANLGGGGGTSPLPSHPVVWRSCGQGFQCGSVKVPLSYAHFNGSTLRIAVIKHPATDSSKPIGTLIFNPGGPGLSGIQALRVLLDFFPAKVRERFNLVSFDPRGSGSSERINCGTSLIAAASAPLVAMQPDGSLPSALGVYKNMATSCRSRYPKILSHINTVDTARDMDRIRAAIGASRISYLGISYGTLLGAVYAQLFPNRVRAMLLDGGIDPTMSLLSMANSQAPAWQEDIVHFLGTCFGQNPCPLGSSPTAFYRQLVANLTTHPLVDVANGDNYPVTTGDLETAALEYATLPSFTGPQFVSALVFASHGNGEPLRNFALGEFTDLNGTSELDSYWTVTCEDTTNRPTALQIGQAAVSLADEYPLLDGYSVSTNAAGCTYWPPAHRPIPPLHPLPSIPIVVVGSTYDPITPYSWSKDLAGELQATLVTRVGYGHTWFLNGQADTCMDNLVADFFVTGRRPQPDIRCIDPLS
ncbi:MAG: alpha/beta hydrolase [Actinobacteria bacterium]|nr:alpha/beta hydrolase [Actinomycetota bacterium]MCL6105175.1 alpha/beta hydrolase [Actinomycetota bacterium]